MKGHRYLWAGIGFAFLLTGCATETAEFKSLREQVRLQQKQIVDLKARQEEQHAKLEILDNGFKILGNKVEENGQRLDERVSQEDRLAPSTPIISAPAPPPRPMEAAPAAPARPETAEPKSPRATEVPVTPPLSAADLYRSALDNFTQENYQRAVLEFEEFVANHPDHDLADNAQYWIGECYYAQKRFEQAVVEFGKVDKHFSSGNKAAAALLKQGLSLQELGRIEEAQVALEKLISKYPSSEEASLAEKRLSQLR